MPMPELKSKIYLVLPEGLATVDLLALVEASIAGGVGIIQYREKTKSTALMIREAAEILALTRPAGVPLLINDRLDVALAVGADGVHMGQDDMAAATARKLIGPDAIVGVTTPTPELVAAAEGDGASYVAIGPIYATPTKPDKPAVGFDAIRRTAEATSLPVCVIGGIDRENIGDIPSEYVDMYSMIRGISDAADPKAATEELVAIVG